MSNSMSSSVSVSDEDPDLNLSPSQFVDLDMNGLNVDSDREELYKRARQVLAQSEHLNWKDHRRPNRYTASSSIVSSSSDEPTIDLNKQNTQCNFYPSEITGRSTATNDASMSVEQILGESQFSNVRELADELRMFKFRESRGGEQLASTEDVSLKSSRSFRSSMSKPDDWDMNNKIGVDCSDVFMPSDRVKDFLQNEEHIWAQEYATLPPEPDFSKVEHSRSQMQDESANESNASFGQFFIKRSEDIREMFPSRSPTKLGRPIALIDSVNSTQDNFTNGFNDSKMTNASALHRNTTSAKDGESFIGHAAIESFFQKCEDYSPNTVSRNLMKLKKPNSAKFVEPLPLKPLNPNANVNISVLKVEPFAGNVAALRERSANPPIPIRSALLTPGGHIRRNDCNKENEVDLRHDENVCDQNLTSDTLSMSGLLSASKVQGNSTKTSQDDDCINLTAPIVSNYAVDQSTDLRQNGTLKTNPDMTSPHSPIKIRKRTRSNDRTSANFSTPPLTTTALDVYYNSNHRLTPSPAQSNSSTPETPTSKNSLDVLFNRNHRLTPSPNRSKDHTVTASADSTPSKPVASFHHSNGLHSTQSTNFLGPYNSNMRNFDPNLRSPRLLTQSNSQFSSVSDLREFAIKSSQSVISWPSQKLRTPNMKQFTIKNIGGKKLTMKIEVIGPGFQLSPSEPFQLVALQAQKCRTISVTFCPIALGAVVAKLNFCHAKDTADKTIRKMIPLFGYGGHTVVEVQGVSQGVVGNPFLQLGTVGDLLNLQMCGSFSVYNKGPLSGVAIIRVKSDLKKSSGSSSYSALTITPAKSVIGPDSHTRIDVVYRPRKNDVRKLLRQEGNILGVATLEVFMADEPSRQRISGLINKFANNSSDIYLLDELFRGISTNVVENFAEFQETEEMIGELFNKMKSTEIVLTVKRSTMDQTIESEHDFFMSDTNESMFFHTLVSDDVCAPMTATTKNLMRNPTAATNIPSSPSVLHNPAHRSERTQGITDNWYLNRTDIRLNPHSIDGAKDQIQICSKSRSQQIFEISSNYPHLFIIEPECGVISPGSIATVNVSIKNTTLPNDAMYIRIRVDKKQDAVVPVIIEK